MRSRPWSHPTCTLPCHQRRSRNDAWELIRHAWAWVFHQVCSSIHPSISVIYHISYLQAFNTITIQSTFCIWTGGRATLSIFLLESASPRTDPISFSNRYVFIVKIIVPFLHERDQIVIIGVSYVLSQFRHAPEIKRWGKLLLIRSEQETPVVGDLMSLIRLVQPFIEFL